MTAATSPVETYDTSSNGRGKIEGWLRDNGVDEFEFKAKLALNRIDRKASRSNQARPLHPIDEDWVVILAEALQKNPSGLPPIVVVKQSNGKFKILDGNHRDEAAGLLDIETLPAYVITQTLTETQERLLAITGNKDHGLNVDLDTRVRHALWLVESRGLSHTDAADAVGAPVHRVRQMVAVERATRRATAVDHKAISRLSGGTRMRLDNVRSDVVHAALTKLAVETHMSQTELNPIVSAINREKTEEHQLAVVEEERKRRATEIMAASGGKVPMPTPYRNLRSVLSRATRLDVPNLAGIKVDPAVRDQVKKQAQDAIARLQELVKAL